MKLTEPNDGEKDLIEKIFERVHELAMAKAQEIADPVDQKLFDQLFAKYKESIIEPMAAAVLLHNHKLAASGKKPDEAIRMSAALFTLGYQLGHEAAAEEAPKLDQDLWLEDKK